MRTVVIFLILIFHAGQMIFAACGDVLYVDSKSTSVSPDGLSWNTAYSDLQSALDDAQVCPQVQEIWIAGGTYKPTVDHVGGTSSGDRNLVFNIDFNVKIYGGFCGWETQLSERIKYLCPTILSGDHDGDEILVQSISNPNFTFTNDDDNSYNVLRMKNLSSVAIIDGLTIKGGNADHPSTLSKRIGGAIFNDGRGLNNSSNPRIQNCIFEFNKSIEGGGAIYNYGVNSVASPSITTSEFRYNRSLDHGGAIYNHGEGSSALSNPIISSCIFERNRAANNGGAVYGVGVSNGKSQPSISQSTFVYNIAISGAGLYIQHPSAGATLELTVVGCIFYSNNSVNGGASSFYGSNATINAEYCLYPEAVVDQINYNQNVDPQFVNSFSNFRLQSSSIAIDNGKPDGIGIVSSDKDLDDNARMMGSHKDIGAYEYLSCPSNNTIYVNATSSNTRNGIAATSALSSLNMALNMACDCESIPRIHVANGRYIPHRYSDLTFDSDISDHKFTVACPLEIRGQAGTVFSGDVLNNDGSIDTIGRFDNSTTVLYVLSDTLSIDSVEISNGNTHGMLVQSDGTEQDIEVTNCNFLNNQNNALYVRSFVDSRITLKVTDSHFSKNFILGSGSSDGALKVSTTGYTDIEVSNCIFRDNDMGGIYLILRDSSVSLINRCLFDNNLSYIGSGIEISNSLNQTSFHTISNCVFTDNTAEASGAAIYGRRSYDTHYKIDNCTFFRNFTDQNVSGALNFFQNNGSATVTNCIFWENSNPIGLLGMSGDMDVSYSIVETESCPPRGVRCNEVMMYNVDPHFKEENGTFGTDLNLKTISPAINRGNRVIYETEVMFGPIIYDFAGKKRFRSSRIDLGAYEYQPVDDEDCPLSVTNPVASPETSLSISALSQSSIELSQEYITPSNGALFLDARSINIYPSLSIVEGAVVEIYTVGCSESR